MLDYQMFLWVVGVQMSKNRSCGYDQGPIRSRDQQQCVQHKIKMATKVRIQCFQFYRLLSQIFRWNIIHFCPKSVVK